MQIKFFKTKKSFKKHDLDFKPDLYWRLIILVVFILAILSFLFGYYLFMQVNHEADLSSNLNVTTKETVKKERLEKVLEYFSTRETTSAEILNSPPLVVDPSL